ncbi:Mss1p NDAI_0B01500 [Naumovozyma dairenensis CBS 421]|uniref:TrmE-type G domain-containing protein n=1 Tax=Naumovozyma dairenensis (strain ATCC 10597 / BCRC 20456 / CBS 421 / NBRC 0211 / NRRL Y-12639) TaxID=1071378 RepID=G0W5X3_NAUDC|nr:hypothetical protein NDAI_0B01500 [Naumovozyma dairenensis CBS 421]CCD23184.1 hypothetical protein NDAI_0B01500 [Naumovozyma dairenensis CBS 421]
MFNRNTSAILNNICYYSTRSITEGFPTIYALSTPPGQRSAIAIIRISGQQSLHVYQSITGNLSIPKPRTAILKNIYEPSSLLANSKKKKNLIDSSLFLYFQSPNSFTGENLLEIHCHGGKAVTSAILKSIQSLNDPQRGVEIRYAGPGEFSRRAFQNNKFDLTELESINQLIEAETEIQRKCIISSFTGENNLKFEIWRQDLIKCVANLTAIIDFGEDIEMSDVDSLVNKVKAEITQIKVQIESFLNRLKKSRILKDGIKISLIGKPNAGKSSLVNCLTSNETSIVSDIPGTTRDVVDSYLDIDGYKVILTDTAGIRQNSTDIIEKMGIAKALKSIKSSDVSLLIIDISEEKEEEEEEITNAINNLIELSEAEDKRSMIILNKKDLVNDEDKMENITERLTKSFGTKYPIVPVSCITGDGIKDLTDMLTKEFKTLSEDLDESSPILMSQRVTDILQNDVLFGIESFINSVANEKDIVMATEDLNVAIDGIGKITGQAVGVDEILDFVFSKFCVGK